MNISKENRKEYNSWSGMRDRCDNPRNKKYAYYGGRGITYESTWRVFSAFLLDMGNIPKDGKLYSIERENSDGNYCKENCKWILRSDQWKTQRNIHWITVDGITNSLSEWSRQTGIGRHGILYRLSKGMSYKEAVFTKSERGRVLIPMQS